MPALQTGDLDLGNYVASGVFEKNVQTATIPRLAPEAPEKLLVGKTDVITLKDTPKAELVGESQQKSATPRRLSKVTVRTYKVQYTDRFSDEVLQQDEDAQIGVVDAYTVGLLKALSRAIDLVGYHGVNPLTGLVASQADHYVDQEAGRVYDADAGDALDEAVDMLFGNGYSPNGIAMDPKFVGALRKLKNTDGTKRFAQIGFGANVDNFEGLNAAVSNTVSGSEEMAAADAVDRAIVGDFTAIKFSIVKTVPVELIQYGDPDGLGDLKRQNEIALRGESYFAVALLDPTAVVVITSDPADERAPIEESV
jgi:HK97 family phage major capsid protein